MKVLNRANKWICFYLNSSRSVIIWQLKTKETIVIVLFGFYQNCSFLLSRCCG